MEILTQLATIIPDWLEAILAVIVAATAVTAITPTQIDDKYLGYATKAVNFLLKITNIIAGNVLKNKNADSE